MALTLLSIEEAAERYHISLEQLRKRIDDGRIVPVAVNGHVLLDDDEVRKVAGNNGNHLHWIPLKEAAARYSLEETLLEVLVKEGKVRSGTLDDEPQVAVEDMEVVAARLSRSNFRHLEGKPIEIARAVERYGFTLQSMLDWARQGHIRILKPTRRPVLLDEADVAYAKALADVRGLVRGKALFPTSRQYRPAPPPWLSR